MKKVFILLFLMFSTCAFALDFTNPVCLEIGEYSCAEGGAGRGAVHPDIIYYPEQKDGYYFWAYFTPWPQNDDEDLYLFRSNDLETWVDTGVTNPLLENVTEGWAFYADPAAVELCGKTLMFSGPKIDANNAAITLHVSSDGKSFADYSGTGPNGNTSPVLISGLDTDGRSWELSGDYSMIQYPSAVVIPDDDWSDCDGDEIWIYYGYSGGDQNTGDVGLAKMTFDTDTNKILTFARYDGSGTDGALFKAAQHDEGYMLEAGCGHVQVITDGDGFTMLALRHLQSGSTNGFPLTRFDSDDGVNWTFYNTIAAPTGSDSTSTYDNNGFYRSSFIKDKYGEVVKFGADAEDAKRIIMVTGYEAPWDTTAYRFGFLEESSFSSGAAAIDLTYADYENYPAGTAFSGVTMSGVTIE